MNVIAPAADLARSRAAGSVAADPSPREAHLAAARCARRLAAGRRGSRGPAWSCRSRSRRRGPRPRRGRDRQVDAVEHLGRPPARWRSPRGGPRTASSSAIARGAPAQARIEHVAQAVAEQVEAHDGEEDGDARRRPRTTRRRAGTRATPRSSAPTPGVGGGGPSPRKPSAAAVRMVNPMPIDARTMIGEAMFGSTCSTVSRHGEAPRAAVRLDEGLLLERARLGVDQRGRTRASR